MKRLIMSLFAGALIFTSCSTEQKNPLLAEWDTPFETPPFDKITTEHYLPAFEKAIKVHNNEIDKIANKCFYFATNTAYNLGHTDEVANHMMLKNNKYKKLSCNVNKYILKLQLEIPHLDINFIMSIIPTTDKSDDDNKIIKLVDITV